MDSQETDKVLDLGCGYGVVGILAAKIIGGHNVVMIDIDEEAIRLSRKNCLLNDVQGVRIQKSDGFANLIILPPYFEQFMEYYVKTSTIWLQ